MLLSVDKRGDGWLQLTGDGLCMALAEGPRNVRIYDRRRMDTPLVLPKTSRCMFVGLSADGKWAATGTWKGEGRKDPTVCVWDARTAKLICPLPVPLDANVAFSPDNHWLVTASRAEFRFWEVGTWKPGYRLPVDTERYGLITFAPDSRIAALSTDRSGVRLLDLTTMTELARLEDDDDERPLGFGPDGSMLATVGRRDTIRLWDLRIIRKELREIGLDWAQPPLPPPQVTAPIDIILEAPMPANTRPTSAASTTRP